MGMGMGMGMDMGVVWAPAWELRDCASVDCTVQYLHTYVTTYLHVI
jgi:hypothetical protein